MRLVLHIPHSSKHVPANERRSLLLSDDALHRELLHMTDAYTDELFSLPHAATVRYPVSRLVADPERFADDAEEVMTKVGMGVIYTKTCCGRPLRQPPSPEERKAILAQLGSLPTAVPLSLHSHYSRFLATTGPSATLSPSFHFLVLPVIGRICSSDFSLGRGGLLQLLNAPCHRAAANTPPKWFAASVSLWRAMLPAPSSEGFGL